MDKKNLIIIVAVIVIIIVFLGLYKQSFIKEDKTIDNPNNQEEQKENNNSDSANIANPASQFCKDQGGSIEIRTLDDGSQYGVCIFKNGVECEEWDLFSGRCNKDGSDFCGESTYGACSDDLDCQTDGCSGQICKSKKDESFVTDCQIKECNDSKKYGLSCACQESKCQWSK